MYERKYFDVVCTCCSRRFVDDYRLKWIPIPKHIPSGVYDSRLEISDDDNIVLTIFEEKDGD